MHHGHLDWLAQPAAGEDAMNTLKLMALILIVGGVIALAFGGFSYSTATHSANIGGLHLAMIEQQRVNIPMWAGIGAIIVGALLMLTAKRS